MTLDLVDAIAPSSTLVGLDGLKQLPPGSLPTLIPPKSSTPFAWTSALQRDSVTVLVAPAL